MISWRAALSAGVALLLAGAAGLEGQDARSYERLVGFATFFEPETAALLGISPEAGRMSDLSEEGLAARARGYGQIRASLPASPLFPSAPAELADALDPRRFADRRVVAFHSVRAWGRSPLLYVREAAQALAAPETDSAASASQRRQALTERARQVPYLLDAAMAALVNPPQLLAIQAATEARQLDRWIGAAADRASALPEGGEKWALTQALGAARSALRSFLEWLEADMAPRAYGVPGLGEAVLTDVARSCGLDGAYHLLELLGQAAAATPRRDAAEPAESGALPGQPGDSAGVADLPPQDRAISDGLSDAAARAWLFAATPVPAADAAEDLDEGVPGTDAVVGEQDGTVPAAARRLVAWDGLGGATRWLAAVTRSGEDGAFSAAALQEAEAARIAALVHFGRLDPPVALEQLAATGTSRDDASRLLAGHLSDPAGICAPALGVVLLQLWEEEGRPSPATLLANWLRADPARFGDALVGGVMR